MTNKPSKLTFLNQFKLQIENEIDLYCDDYINIISYNFLQRDEKIQLEFQTRIFYMKQKADFQRYKCEYKTGKELHYVKQLVNDYYKSIIKELKENKEKNSLKPYDITKLGVYLNYSLFWNDHMEDKNQAYEIMYEHYKKATEHIAGLPQSVFEDTKKLLSKIEVLLLEWKPQNLDDEEKLKEIEVISGDEL